ncbi:MAG: hypothetical protein OHK0023_10420 [Anaerolineae bacterium]
MTENAVEGRSSFVEEVQTERLSLLWKVTLGIAIFIYWSALVLSASGGINSVSDTLLANTIAVLGCLITGWLLRRNQYDAAVWTYAGGLFLALSIILHSRTNGPLSPTNYLIAFAFPCVVLIVTLLLPLRKSVYSVIIGVVLILFVPSLGREAQPLTVVQIGAVLVLGLTAFIAAQFSGEMYSIAEWALRSYQKERQFKEQLFDSQQQIQRSLLRQQALTDQLQNANVELEKARAAEAEAKNFRGQFLANMSHELRTPLNAIIGFSETMLKYPMMYQNVTLPDAYRKDIDQIFNSGKHLLQLINDVLDLAKVDAGRLDVVTERVELAPIFDVARSTGLSLIGAKQVEFKVDLPEAGLPDLSGDPLRIQQVVLNLISNAAKFTESGSITVGGRVESPNEVLLWVRDTGIGIPESDRELIFEEFRQGAGGRRAGRAGSGLGLTITRHLLRLMGGKIWVESEVGKGSTFYFTLPIYVEPLAESTPVSTTTTG